MVDSERGAKCFESNEYPLCRESDRLSPITFCTFIGMDDGLVD